MPPRTRSTPPLLDPWRRGFQWTATLTILLLPWFHFNGISILRIDIDTLSLHLFGQVLRIEELYLFLFFSLWIILAFLLITLVLGRVWCGWACPQTTLSDVAEWMARRAGLTISGHAIHGRWTRKVIVHLGYVVLALVVGCNLAWYFIEPLRFFRELWHLELHPGAWLFVGTTALTIYLDLAVIRRVMCRDFCPYGRFQSALVDPGTLTLFIPTSESPRCIECGSCVRSCPMEIDIRRGYQIECINCGRCLDACRKVMDKRQQQGLIRYAFGTENKGFAALLHPRTLVLASATILLSVILVAGVSNRSEASLKVSVSHTAASRILDADSQVTFFNAWINNRSTRRMTFRLSANTVPPGTSLEVRGQTHNLQLDGGENLGVEFALLTGHVENPTPVTIYLKDEQDTVHARSKATVLPVQA